MILCWATFIAILGCMQPAGQGLDIPHHSFCSLPSESLRNCLPNCKLIHTKISYDWSSNSFQMILIFWLHLSLYIPLNIEHILCKLISVFLPQNLIRWTKTWTCPSHPRLRAHSLELPFLLHLITPSVGSACETAPLAKTPSETVGQCWPWYM